jgi:hypothetical protein
MTDTSQPDSIPSKERVAFITLVERLEGISRQYANGSMPHYSEVEQVRKAVIAAFDARPAPETGTAPALPMRMDEPWSLPEVLAKLIEATEHSLNFHSCDTHGHELFRAAANAGRSILREWQSTAPALKAGDQP